MSIRERSRRAWARASWYCDIFAHSRAVDHGKWTRFVYRDTGMKKWPR